MWYSLPIRGGQVATRPLLSKSSKWLMHPPDLTGPIPGRLLSYSRGHPARGMTRLWKSRLSQPKSISLLPGPIKFPKCIIHVLNFLPGFADVASSTNSTVHPHKSSQYLQRVFLSCGVLAHCRYFAVEALLKRARWPSATLVLAGYIRLCVWEIGGLYLFI